MNSLLFISFVIFVTYVFDFINGFHDAANSIATIVTTGVLKPRWAVVWAAFFNFIAFLFLKLSVALTIGTGLIDPTIVDPALVLAALTAAILWNLLTWFYGLPSSSSHALIGGLAGAAYAKAGFAVLKIMGFLKVIVAIVLSPLLGLILGLSLMYLLKRVIRYYGLTMYTANKTFRRLQLLSSALLSFSHGSNDAQKTMGIIAMLLFSGPLVGQPFQIPVWVMVSCNLVIALGTLMGGWRIVHTMGKEITYLDNMRGSCAESGAALVIGFATHFGIPVSTTHTVTGSIVGVGLSGGFLATKWSTIRKIVYSWFMALPVVSVIAAIIAKAVYLVVV